MRFIARLVVGAMVCSSVLGGLALAQEIETAAKIFVDVTESHPNYDAVLYVQGQGIVEGYDDDTYRPDKNINRAEFTKIIVEATYDDSEIEGCIGGLSDALMGDVPLDEWFAKYVCVATDHEIVSGYPDGTFRPGQKISFVEAAKIIAIAFGQKTQTVAEGDEWFSQYVRFVSGENAIPTSIDSFGQQITRGEMAEMIYRLKAGVSNKEHVTYGQLAGEDDEVVSGRIEFEGEVLAGSLDKSPLLDFVQADYEKALNSDKTVMLYFYATWCPICQGEFPEKIAAFDELDSDGYVGFRVNYQDSDTDDYEESLARDFAIPVQHTTVILKNGQVKLKTSESLNKDRVIEELMKASGEEEAVKVFNITAQQFEFDPAVITVNEGDKVRFVIKSIDVEHGFSLPTFGINETLSPGETAVVEFTADKAGTYGFFCSVYCGGGHSDMKGQLIVN